MNDMLSRMISLPRRASAGVLHWINDNPLPTAGFTMAALSSGYLVVLVHSAATKADTTVINLKPTRILAIAGNRPAYLLAIIVGVGVLVLWRE